MEIKLINVTSYSITQYACFSTGCEWDSSSLDRTVLEGLSEWNSYCQGFDQSSNENKAASIFEWKYSEGWIANLIHWCIALL